MEVFDTSFTRLHKFGVELKKMRDKDWVHEEIVRYLEGKGAPDADEWDGRDE
jgi:hypothetical protein